MLSKARLYPLTQRSSRNPNEADAQQYNGNTEQLLSLASLNVILSSYHVMRPVFGLIFANRSARKRDKRRQ